MWPFSLFSKPKDSENFETVLEDLRISIASRRQRLAEMRLRERRATLWTTLYLFAVWIVYAGVWYAGWIYALAGVNNRANSNTMLWRKTLITGPVVVGPVVILFTRRIVQLWYTRIANGEEKTLKTLLLEQRAKLEQLKKKTDFYSTQKLLERYDRPDGAAPNPNAAGPARPTGARASLGGPGQQGGQPQPGTQQQQQLMGPPSAPGVGGMNGSQMRTPIRPNAPSQMVTPTPQHPGYMSALSPVPIAPTPRKWYDRLADAVLGEDGDGTPGGGGGAQSKYALICKKCFTHNGLVREEEVDGMQFICMKCGHFNPSPKSIRAGLGGGLGDDTPPSTSLASRLSLSDSPISPSPSMTASTTKVHPTSGPSGSNLASRKGYRVDSDTEEWDDGMDVVPPTPSAPSKATGGKGRKSAAASAAAAVDKGAGAGALKRTGSGRVTRNSRRSEVGEGMELD